MGNSNSLIGILIKSSYDGKGAKEAEASLKALDTTAGNLTGGLSGLAKVAGIAGLAALAVQAGSAVTELARTAAEAGRVETAFQNMTRGGQESGDAILAAMKKASGGMISDANLMLSANRAMLLGVADSGAELAGLLDVARVRGSAMGLSVTEAFDNIVTGLGRMSPLILDNLGITIDLDNTLAAYAETVGKTVSQLDDQERKQALVNRVLKESQDLVAGNAAGGADLAAPFERMDAALANAKQSLGELFGPAVAAVAEAVARDIGQVTKEVEEIGKGMNLSQVENDIAFFENIVSRMKEQLEADKDSSFIDPDEIGRLIVRITQVEEKLKGLREIRVELTGTDAQAVERFGVALGGLVTSSDLADDALQEASRGAGILSDRLRDTMLASTDLGQRGMGMLSDHLRDGAAATNELNATLANSPAVFSMFAAAALAAGVPVSELIGLMDQASAALNRLQGARDSAVSGLASQLAGQVERGLITQAQAQQMFAEGVDSAESSMQGLAQAQATGTLSTDEFALAQALAFQTVDDGAEAIDEADAAARRYSRTLSSEASKAAKEAEKAFSDLKGEVSGVLSEALGDIGGVNPDEILGNLGLREDAIAENARRLADIAANSFKDQDWLGEFASEVPDIFKALTEAGDPQAAAAQMLKEFQSGFRPELLDRDLLKDTVRERLLSNQAKEELATQLATELAAEMNTSIPEALKTARQALGAEGDGGMLALPEIDTGATEAAGQTAGASFGTALTTGIADAGTVAIAKLGEQLKAEDNLKLAQEAGNKYGEFWGRGLLETVQENVPVRLVEMLVSLVTPGVQAQLRQQASLTGAR